MESTEETSMEIAETWHRKRPCKTDSILWRPLSMESLQDEDKIVLALSVSLQNCNDYDFDSAFSALFNWC